MLKQCLKVVEGYKIKYNFLNNNQIYCCCCKIIMS